MNDKQNCHICNKEVHPSQRYPNYVCDTCVDKAKSADGKLVKFYNIDFGGGCRGEYVDTKEKYESDIIYINGVKCKAQEAHFGGIVIKPV